MSSELKEFRGSNDAIDDPSELRRRIGEDGYIFIRGLHDADRLRGLRLEMLEVIRDGGWLRPGTDLNDGIADVSRRCTEGDLEYVDVYHDLYKLESFHRAGHWPEVLSVMQALADGDVLPHPSKIARIWFPQYVDHTTPAHQDFVHFQGSYETYTCWSPVGDCPVDLGGLAVIPGSHKSNIVLEHHFSLGAGSLSVDEDQQTGNWHTTDYEIGDALIFHSLTIHQALPNVTGDRLRISLDNRYQDASLPIAEQMLEPHLSNYGELSWEQVYRDWERKDLQYYWKRNGLDVVPRDASYSDKGFEEALARARKGEQNARVYLERTLRTDPDSDRGKAAAEALRELT